MTWEVNQYLPLINRVLQGGEKRSSRAGTVYSVFSSNIQVDMERGFPLLRGRKMFYKPVLGELAAFLRGPQSIDDFKVYGCNYWDAWGAKGVKDANGDLVEDPMLPDGSEGFEGELVLDYGNAWRDFNGVDQLARVVDMLKNDPTNRRILISGWRPDRLHELSLPCCHVMYQWYVRNGTYLDMIWTQRSVDVMIGLPSDVILAAAWTSILATQCGYKPGKITFNFGDTHIYANHIEPTLDYLRATMAFNTLKQHQNPLAYKVNPLVTVDNFIPEHIEILNYTSGPAIKFELNV